MPKISVIIATYNRAKYLSDAIDSVLKQTYTDYELIVIDDGSTDDTRDVVERYGSQIKYCYKENGGSASAKNEGVKKAKGTYLAFLDSDDIWFPSKLQRQIEVIEKKNAALVHTGRWEMDLLGRAQPFLGPKIPAKSSDEFLSGETHISMTVLVRRDSLVKVGMFDESLKTTSDTDAWLRLAFDYEFFYIDEPLMTFRMHTGNISTNMEQKYTDRCVVIQRMYQNNDQRIPKSKWKKKMEENYYLLGIEKYKKQLYHESFSLILRALMMNPFIGKSNTYSQDKLSIKIKKLFAPIYFLIKGGFINMYFVPRFKSSSKF